MGGVNSRSSAARKKSSHVHTNKYGFGGSGQRPQELVKSTKKQINLSPSKVRESAEKKSQKPSEIKKPDTFHETSITAYGSNEDDFYDGIPRYPRDLSQKSRSTRCKQGSEASSRLGRAGTFGLEKAVEVLDTLGSSMTNLNASSGFVTGVTTKGNELSILAFEVANTIVKGYSLVQSISKISIRQLKEVALPSEGVQHLVSKDMDELLKMVATDKREELKIFAGEVIRFGNRCKDPQWHNLDRYFEKYSREPPKQLKDEPDSVMQQFMTLVQYTADLYQELNTLDRLEEDHQQKHQIEDNSNVTQRGEGLATLRVELKSQKKKVKALKKKSLWSRSMEEVMEKLVDIVLFLNREIQNAFGSTNANTGSSGSLSTQQRLGPAGLALHYANIFLQIDSIVDGSKSVPPSRRNTLYQNLPPSIKSSLRSKLKSFHVKEELTVTEIKAEMEKTLHWLVPIATNTAKAHYGFGWVGEWASTRSEVNRKSTGQIEIIRIDTLHHADKGKTEACILELLFWLNYLLSQSKLVAKSGDMAAPMKSSAQSSTQKTYQQPTFEVANNSSPMLGLEDQGILRDTSNRKRILRMSKSQNFESTKNGLKRHDRLSKSSGHSPASKSDDFLPAKKDSSTVPITDFSLYEEKAMDVIDGVGTHR